MAGIRAQLVAVLGERALQANLLHARHRVACALMLLSALEGRDDTTLDLNAADGEKQLVDRLDAAFGKDARQSLLPSGVNYFGESLNLLNDLTEAEKAQAAVEAEERAIYKRFGVDWVPSPLHHGLGIRIAGWKQKAEQTERVGHIGYIAPSSLLTGLVDPTALQEAAAEVGKRASVTADEAHAKPRPKR